MKNAMDKDHHIVVHHEIILINEEYFKSLIHDINHAKNYIYLETYIYANDQIGMEVTEALCNAAKRNVKIKILVDGIGSPNWGNESTLRMERCGIETNIYHPVPLYFRQFELIATKHRPFFTKLIYFLTRINRRNH